MQSITRSMRKTVIFDIDNTLYDFARANRFGMEAVRDYCRRSFGLEEPHFREYYRKAWRMAGERVGSDTAAIHNRMLRFQCMMELLGKPLFPHVKTLACTYWDTVLEQMKPYPGIAELFRTLHEDQIRIGIGTDMTAYIQYRKLEELGVAPYVDLVVTSEEVFRAVRGEGRMRGGGMCIYRRQCEKGCAGLDRRRNARDLVQPGKRTGSGAYVPGDPFF